MVEFVPAYVPVDTDVTNVDGVGVPDVIDVPKPPEGEDEVGETPLLVLNEPVAEYDDKEVTPVIWLEVDPLGS